jgi:hypothetical protein
VLHTIVMAVNKEEEDSRRHISGMNGGGGKLTRSQYYKFESFFTILKLLLIET